MFFLKNSSYYQKKQWFFNLICTINLINKLIILILKIQQKNIKNIIEIKKNTYILKKILKNYNLTFLI